MDNRDELINKYLPLVRRIAFRFYSKLPSSVQVDDLIQSGTLGLLEAIDNYDDTHGASLDTYASIRIRGAMIDEIRKNDWTPRSIYKKSRSVANAIHDIESVKYSEAKAVEIANYLGISLSDYNKIIVDFSNTRMLNIDNVFNENEIGDDNCPSEYLNHEVFEKELYQAILSLTDREQMVLSLYYDDDVNLKSIGTIINVSESRVSQILSEIIVKLKNKLK